MTPVDGTAGLRGHRYIDEGLLDNGERLREADPSQMLRALAGERLGASEEALSNPLVSASSGALSTAVGAIIPIIPFFFLQGVPAVIAAGSASYLDRALRVSCASTATAASMAG